MPSSRVYPRGDAVTPGGGTPVKAPRLIADFNEDTPPVPLTGNYTLQPSDNGAVFRGDSASGLTVTVPSTLPEGFNVGICQRGTGIVTVVAGGGATLVGPGNKSSQYGSMITPYVWYNPTGTLAEFIVFGGA